MPSEETIYDAIIVGAGPSGCSTAIFLSRAGKNVLLVDRAVFPRDKVCGDAVSGKSIGILRELGLLDGISAQPHGVIKGVLLASPDGKMVSVPFPKGAPGMDCAGYTVKRKQTDNVLFEAARHEPNITIMQKFTVEEIVRDDKGAVCGISGNDAMSSEAGQAKRTFHSRVVVGADGTASIVARQLGLPSVPPEHTFMGIRGYWKGVQGLGENIELFFIDGVLPGYLWVFPLENDTANVGLGILLSDMKERKEHPNKILLDALRTYPALAKRFGPAVQDGPIGAWTIPLGSFKKQNFGDGWIVVGDAAAMVDPFTGEGFGNATTSGKFAAETIVAAIGANTGSAPLPSASLADYEAKITQALRPGMEQYYNMQKLSRNRFLLNLFIGKAATKPEFRQMVIDMLGSNEAKKQAESPLFLLKLLLP